MEEKKRKRGEKNLLTDSNSQICTAKHLDRQIRHHLANHLDGVVHSQVSLAIQRQADLSIAVYRGLFAAELDDFPDDPHSLMLEIGEVGCAYSRGCFGHGLFFLQRKENILYV
jgi:hypothetical protein